ncbi:UNVERIFIED_CONTAM: hypothetical protein HDU68_001560 [Siphonaria sp. JEL0065]|nr:hypothetical protein HDU68_001560 [Siphonaria sp. JEL0065]
MTATLDQTVTLFETLKKDFNTPNPDLKKCGQHLSTLKLNLTQLSFLQTSNPKELLLTREILEIGAQWSIKAKDIPSFERYIAQLKTYYNDYSTSLPVSQRQYPLLGLNLLRLLSQNRIAEFHTELELIDPEQLDNIYIKHPLTVEQSLMEGSYNKVWNSKTNVPAEEYAFFIDILMSTIRNEIGSCSEKAYDRLPIADAATLLYFKTPKEVVDFAATRGWTVSGNQIVFAQQHVLETEIPAPKIIRNALGYARELERIDATIPYLRDLISSATEILESTGFSNNLLILEGLVLEMILSTKETYPKRISRDPPTRSEYFRSQEYVKAAKYRLYNDFPMHYKHTIKQTLLNSNNSYSTAHATLLETTPPKFWSLLPFTSRTPISLPETLKNNPEILADLSHMQAQELAVLCEKDIDLARELNEQEYERFGELIECPVCIDTKAFEEFVACLRGCLVCRECLGRYIRVGVYESGELRGRVVDCFLEVDDDDDGGNDDGGREGGVVRKSGKKIKCGYGYGEGVLEGVLGKDVWRVVEGLVNERIVREAFGDGGVCCCGVCGYAGELYSVVQFF